MGDRINAVSAGFTLVELVTVLVIIGALSALGIGLFASRSAFSPLLATQQLASAALLAQQAALAGNPANTLTVEQDADRFTFTVGAATPSPRVFEMKRNGTTLSVAGGLPLTLTFNSQGTLSTGNNLALTFSGDSLYVTCVSSLGAVYAGNCQP